ncbi:hypothetical protein B0T14DRAFT_530316 [Immersiella caudata]|uniref:Uncharacterized protein n=1 Tax=Immersiella caudata TaxID=314043 RepID=A0AA39U457_9PEZI|nr:hypothetical protein B0T14DRAFT_530316 [Immersiella caudata]
MSEHPLERVTRQPSQSRQRLTPLNQPPRITTSNHSSTTYLSHSGNRRQPTTNTQHQPITQRTCDLFRRSTQVGTTTALSGTARAASEATSPSASDPTAVPRKDPEVAAKSDESLRQRPAAAG